MALTATDNWCWYLDREHNLCIELGDEYCFRTAYQRRFLIPHIIHKQRQSFDLEQAEYYQSICDSLHQYRPDWSDAQITQIGLNAAAVRYMIRMVANRSWLFANNEIDSEPVWRAGSVAEIHSSMSYAQVLLVRCEQSAACCLLLDELELAETRAPLLQFSPLRINLDRLHPPRLQLPRRAYPVREAV